jgi:tetratricopeptide (TPR) repeat protein
MAVKIFYCYAHEDKVLRASLEKHLGTLKQLELITGWSDRDIDAGKEWAKEVDSNLNTADIILLLISPDFVHSDYCYSIEMKRALERHENGTVRVIPIILRHIDFEGASFSHLQSLPTDGIPVTDRKWRNRDEAFRDVALGIRKVVKEVLSQQEIYEGNVYFYRQQYDEALSAFEQAIYLNPSNALAHIGKGQTLNQLASPLEPFMDVENYSERALAAFEQAIQLDSTNSQAYEGKGKALFKLEPRTNKEKVLGAYKQAISLGSKTEATYIGQGDALMYYDCHEEALAAYEKAIEVALLPSKDIYRRKGNALHNLKHYEEALAFYDQNLHEFPSSDNVYVWKGIVLYELERYEEALAAYNKAISLGYKSAQVYKTVGDILCQMEHYKEALDAYEKATNLNSTLYGAYEGKATVLQILANEALEKAGDPLRDLEDHPF